MIEDFLTTLWPRQNLFGELRVIQNGEVKQWWFGADDVSNLGGPIRDWSREGADVYFGVLQRTKRGGTSADCTEFTSVLWADVDAKHTGGKWPALTGIQRAKQQPSVIVDSGHGFHAYWLLTQPVEFSQAQPVMKALAREIHGDAVYDQARILRVPGTTNWKDPENPVPVRLIYWDVERRYRIGDFDVLAEASVGRQVAGISFPTRDLPSWLTAKLQFVPPKGSRSEAVFSAVLWLCRYGWDDDQIVDAIINSPIGEKYHEKGNDGPRWLKATIKAARRAAT